MRFVQSSNFSNNTSDTIFKMKNKRTTDYIIIGGGIIGCSTAYNLANQGAKSVIVLEKGETGNGDLFDEKNFIYCNTNLYV